MDLFIFGNITNRDGRFGARFSISGFGIEKHHPGFNPRISRLEIAQIHAI